MTLYINTASHDEVIIALFKNKVDFADRAQIIARKKFRAPRRQAEKLLPAIEQLLKAKKIKLGALKKIIVANCGGSFTSLRIGVITANALGYALNIPVAAEKVKSSRCQAGASKKFGAYSLVVPLYDREPNIGLAKKLVTGRKN